MRRINLIYSFQIKNLQRPAECDELPEQRGILPAPLDEAASKIQSAIRSKTYQDVSNNYEEEDNEPPVRKISIVPKHFQGKSPGIKSNYSAYSSEAKSDEDDDEELAEIDRDINELNKRLASYKKPKLGSQIQNSFDRQKSAERQEEDNFDQELNNRLAAYKNSSSYNSASRDSNESSKSKEIVSETPEVDQDSELNRRLSTYKSSGEYVPFPNTNPAEIVETSEDDDQVELNRRLSTFKSSVEFVPEKVTRTDTISELPEDSFDSELNQRLSTYKASGLIESSNLGKEDLKIEEESSKNEDAEEIVNLNRRLSTFNKSISIEKSEVKTIGEIDETVSYALSSVVGQ